MGLFRNFLNEKTFLGVDIGTTSIKIAEVERKEQGFELVNYGVLETHGYLERYNEALQSSTLKLSETNTPFYVKMLLKHAGIHAKSSIVSLPAFLTFSTLIEVPSMSDSEIKKFMEYQGRQYIPLPLENIQYEWVKVGERKDETGSIKHQVFLVSVPKEYAAEYKKIFDQANIVLKGIEIEGMGLARSLTLGMKDPTLIVDIGGRSTSFSVAVDGMLKFSGQTDFSGGSLTQTVAKGLGISPLRAEELKKQRGLIGLGGEHELSTLIQPTLDVIISEAKRVATDFESNYKEKVARVILSGGGANMPGLEEYFSKQFGMEAKRANPFQYVKLPAVLTPIAQELGPVLSVAIGLGAKGLE
ncbi:MAG: type IV pilus assembly protein PilM [Patescibacteria group bacterium]